MATKSKKTPEVVLKLRGHFGSDPGKLKVLQEKFQNYERSNLHLALTELLGSPGWEVDMLGVVHLAGYAEPTLAQISNEGSAQYFFIGPVQYVVEALPGGQQLSCVKQALYLLRQGSQHLALLVSEREMLR